MIITKLQKTTVVYTFSFRRQLCVSSTKIFCKILGIKFDKTSIIIVDVVVTYLR